MTTAEVVRCAQCNRPLKTTDSRALGYGPVCAAGVLGFDTHRTPTPRPRRDGSPNQLSFGSFTVPKGPTNVITIKGASDDTITVDGAIKAEFYVAGTGHNGVLLVASNGVVLRIQFETCWRIDLVTGRDLVQIVPCPEDDEDNYSDVATIPGDVDWVVCRDTFVTD